MKLFKILTLCLLAGLANTIQAQDTLYILKKGVVEFKQALSDIDSLSFINSKNLSVVERLAQDKNFSLFSEALEATGYAGIIRTSPTEDKSYDPKDCIWAVKMYNIKEEIPTYRKFGFTLLMESDLTLANYKDCPLCPNGINNLNDLELLAKYWYSDTYQGLFADGVGVTDRKDSRNYLNRFVAYHILAQKLYSSRFIDDFDTPNQVKTFNLEEYKETLLQNSLLQIKKDRNYSLTSFLNLYDANVPTSGVKIAGVTMIGSNGYGYEIDKPMVYSRRVYEYLSSIRLRMDVASFFHEFASNNMRGNNPTAVNVAGKAHRYIIPAGYCDNLSFSPTTRMTYLNANGIYEDFEGDELYIEGTYDFSITTLPIPAGTYEVRFGYQPTDWRGSAQMYLDGAPSGPPVNFSLLANNAAIGWVIPGADINDPLGYANDSLLHTRGYMKGPSSFKCSIGLYYDPTKTARQSIKTLRKIVGTYTFTEPGKHTIRIQNTGSSGGDVQFMLDYFEFVPVSILKKEGVD
jgi:hypothetical protein